MEVLLLGLALIAALAVSSPAPPSEHARTDPGAADSLGASTELPWNPPSPMPRRRGWERTVLLPGRVVSLPLVGLGWATDNLILQMEQNPRFANLVTPHASASGRNLVVRGARMGDRAGLGGAVELHADLLNGARTSRVAAEYAATLRQYGRTLLTWTGRPLSLQLGEEWRPEERFYGMGNDASRDDMSDYAVQREFVRAGMGWRSNPEGDPTRGHSAFAVWGGPRSQVTRTGRENNVASFETRFPTLGAATLNRRVEHLVYGASLLGDFRTGSPHWSRGWRTLVAAERFDAPLRALALRSAAGAGAAFTRFTAEAEAGFSFMRDPRTVRLYLRLADQDAGTRGGRFLLSDLSTLGGNAGLGGFTPGRFHDMDLVLTRLDYVFPLERSFEMDLHSEWGAVYPDLWRDTALRTLHHSFGFSLRARSPSRPRGAIGFDFSREGARLRFSLGSKE